MRQSVVLAAFLGIVLGVSPLVRADRDDHRGGERHEEHEEHEHDRGAPRAVTPVPTPPPFQRHSPGARRGPVAMPPPVRVLPPAPYRRGEHTWRHWEHPAYPRPTYYWNWSTVRSVTCVAQDSYGDQYPVTEPAYPGFNAADVNGLEDQALNRCFAESGGDQNCFLASCSTF